MATFNKEIKSNRLLQGTRYTIAQFDGQEAFTSVLDLNASEIYTQEEALPTTGLPYSGSEQDNQTILSGSDIIARYYYRMRLTPSDVAVDSNSKYNTWFTISGSDGTAVTPQLIQTDQVTQWISNKYLAASNASFVAESTDPTTVGYKVVLSKNVGSDNAEAADPLSVNDYQFDYKTGVVQFVSDSVSPSKTDYIYLSGYVYEGQTLDQFISSGSSGGEGTPGGANTQIQFNNSDAFGGSPRLTFDSSIGKTTVSGSLILSGSSENEIFLIKSGSIDIAKVDTSGNFILVPRTGSTPTAAPGAIMYSSSAFYVGIE